MVRSSLRLLALCAAVLVPACGGGSVEPALTGVFVIDGSTLALWRFNEMSGLLSADATGNGWDLTRGGDLSTPGDEPVWTAGRFGGGLGYDAAASTYASGA